MSNIIAVDGELSGFAIRGNGSQAVTVPKGDYRIEASSGPGERLLLCPLKEHDWHYAVPINDLKAAKALGRIRFVNEKQKPENNTITDSVNRMLEGGDVAGEIRGLYAAK